MKEHRITSFLLTEFGKYLLQENWRGIYLENSKYIITNWVKKPNI